MSIPASLKIIPPATISYSAPIICVDIAYSDLVQKLGEPHAAPTAKEASADAVHWWFFELPWGQQIGFEYPLPGTQCLIHFATAEINAALEYLELQNWPTHLNESLLAICRQQHPAFTADLCGADLFRQDDNGNKILMRHFESRRVAEFYRQHYESLGHKQLYWVEAQRPLPPFHIRLATLADAARIAPLFDAYRQFYQQAPDLPLARNFITERLQANQSEILLAELNNGEAAGFCQLYPSFCSILAAPVYVLYDLYVAPTARRLGLGAALLEAAEQHARTNGYARLDLTTARTNLPAQALYQAQGWTLDAVYIAYSKQTGCHAC